MSSNRWGQSTWYTYWKSGVFTKVEGQILVIAYSIDKEFTLSLYQIESDLPSELSRIKVLTGASIAQIEELQKYCLEFASEARRG